MGFTASLVDQVFEHGDVDGSGALSPAELVRVLKEEMSMDVTVETLQAPLTPHTHQSNRALVQTPRMGDGDTDGDGQLGKAEFRRFFVRYAGASVVTPFDILGAATSVPGHNIYWWWCALARGTWSLTAIPSGFAQ
jgi:hypothetical protein